MNVKVWLLICFLISACAGFSQSMWLLAREKDGIKVYTASESSSKLKSIKVEAVLTGTLQNLVKILRDVKNNKQWVYNTKQSYPLKEVNPNEILYYSETDLPWPISNRDNPVRLRLKLNATDNTLTVAASGEPDAYPVQKGIVRVQFYNSLWSVKFDGKDKLNIIYYLRIDPGNVPASMSNIFLTKGPFQTFENLARLLK